MKFVAIALHVWLFFKEIAGASATISLPSFLDSGMVLQHSKPVNFWGLASGGTVEVSFAGTNYTAVLDSAGRWSTVLPPTAPTLTPYTITISVINDAGVCIEEKEVIDVLFGEVYICSGQVKRLHVGQLESKN
jgi:hypothetical protein